MARMRCCRSTRETRKNPDGQCRLNAKQWRTHDSHTRVKHMFRFSLSFFGLPDDVLFIPLCDRHAKEVDSNPNIRRLLPEEEALLEVNEVHLQQGTIFTPGG